MREKGKRKGNKRKERKRKREKEREREKERGGERERERDFSEEDFVFGMKRESQSLSYKKRIKFLSFFREEKERENDFVTIFGSSKNVYSEKLKMYLDCWSSKGGLGIGTNKICVSGARKQASKQTSKQIQDRQQF